MSVPTGVCLEICWDWLIVSRHQPRCQLCQPPRCAGHLTAATWGAAPATTPAPGTGWSGGTLTQPRLFLRALIKYLIWNQNYFFYYIRHAHFHSYSDAKYCPVEPNLGKCKATWLRFVLLIQFSHNCKFNTWFCWSVILYSIYPAHLIPWWLMVTWGSVT